MSLLVVSCFCCLFDSFCGRPGSDDNLGCVGVGRSPSGFPLDHERLFGRFATQDRPSVATSLHFAKDEQLEFDSLAARCRGGQQQTMAKGRTPDRFLLRRRGRQGSPFTCPVVREFLFDWFVDIRASVASNLTPRFVMMKAREMGGHALQHMRETGVYSALPSFDREWLRRWKTGLWRCLSEAQHAVQVYEGRVD